MSLNRGDIAESVSENFFFTRAEVLRAIDYTAEKAARTLQKGERVYIRGFGSLHKVTRKKRKVRDIQTGKIITIPRRETVEFRPSKALLKKINKLEVV